MGGQRHDPATLPPGNTRYPLYRRLGGPQGRSGWVRKILPPLGFDPRTSQPVKNRYTDYTIPAHPWYMHLWLFCNASCVIFVPMEDLIKFNPWELREVFLIGQPTKVDPVLSSDEWSDWN